MRVWERIGRRLLRTAVQAVPTVLGIVVLNFFLLKAAPGDAADAMAAESGSATAETMAAMRHRFGLDNSVLVQLLDYLNNLAHLSLGFSPRYNMGVLELVGQRLPGTLTLMIVALAIAVVLGVAVGAVMAAFAGRIPDRILSILSLLFYSTPGFWVGLMLIVVFSVNLGWLPSGGSETIGSGATGLAAVLDKARYMILPSTSLALFYVSVYARLTRASMLEVKTQDFVRTARAKGLSPAAVTIRHVLRNALIPITTLAGMHIGSMLGGAVVVETVYSWPGLGRLAFEAVMARDFSVLLGILLLSSLLVIAANVLVDVLHAWLDPRIGAYSMSASEVGTGYYASRYGHAAAEDLPPELASPTTPEWANLRAPDARLHSAAAVPRRNGLRAVKALLHNPNALFGIAFLSLVVIAALLAPVIYPDDPLSMVATPLLWPGQDSGFPLGSDSLGRDVLSGILWGSRVSLVVGLAATALGLGVGVVIGAIAGYFGGWVDDLLVRLIEIFQTLPSFVLLVVLVAIAEPTVWTITAGIAIVSWPTVARLTRAEFRALREKDFVMAARSLGYGHARIIFREILPNALPPLIVTSSVMVASAILMEAALSFMGLGDPNVVSWGSMIGAGRELIREAWYLTAIPGVAIVFTVLSLNLIADGLNDALNPRLAEER